MVKIEDRVAVAGTHKNSPLELHSRILLQRGASLWISSTFPFKVYRCTGRPPPSEMFSEGPVLVKVEARSWLCPLIPLNPGFVRGWNKLPTEMKLHVLGYILTFHQPLSCPYLDGRGSSEFQALDRLALSTPDMAKLSREVFYATNTITISMLTQEQRVRLNTNPQYAYKIPPPNTLPLLRKVRVMIGPFQHHWERLNILSNLKQRCPKLRELTVVLRWDWGELEGSDINDLDDKVAWISGYRIHHWQEWSLKSNVDLQFAGTPFVIDYDDWLDDEPIVFQAGHAVIDTLEAAVRRKIRFLE
ncbi:hypothetical protein P171DRAFT_480064 [Karstenula rhodostoma CBS 690.94]|uniref:Uncharacterized protein n=1 Tax=Karstenula rhodostoma CBS 690.94 TaxID=1392251 RepID=A0A9P4PVK3_9PLEO|nr:hypothetical protein P171DRAFT_480064 [Karstenula rhodostoma CBS 690.94]